MYDMAVVLFLGTMPKDRHRIRCGRMDFGFKSIGTESAVSSLRPSGLRRLALAILASFSIFPALSRPPHLNSFDESTIFVPNFTLTRIDVCDNNASDFWAQVTSG